MHTHTRVHEQGCTLRAVNDCRASVATPASSPHPPAQCPGLPHWQPGVWASTPSSRRTRNPLADQRVAIRVCTETCGGFATYFTESEPSFPTPCCFLSPAAWGLLAGPLAAPSHSRPRVSISCCALEQGGGRHRAHAPWYVGACTCGTDGQVWNYQVNGYYIRTFSWLF